MIRRRAKFPGNYNNSLQIPGYQGISPRRPVRIGLHPPPRSPIRTSVFWSLKNSPHFAGVSAGSNTECASLRPVEGAIGLILAPGSLGSAKRATYASSRVIRAGGARVSEPGPCLIAYAHGARVYVRVGSWQCKNDFRSRLAQH